MMTVPVSELPHISRTEPPRKHRGRPWLVVGALAAALIVGFVVLVGPGLVGGGGSVPSFPSLAEHPDPSLHGTVAYYANESGCIRLASASGQHSKTLWCLPSEDSSAWTTIGKPAGPQLRWRGDGALEVTMFRMKPGPGKGAALSAGWQKVIDARTGQVKDVAAAQVPSTPETTTGSTLSPSGQQISYSFDAASGRATVTLADRTRTRTLLSIHGPGMYTYQFGPVFWAPNWQWVAAADDDRILVITPGTPSATRVLVTHSGGGEGGGPAGPAFAVTRADLLDSPR